MSEQPADGQRADVGPYLYPVITVVLFGAAALRFQTDGNLVLYDAADTVMMGQEP